MLPTVRKFTYDGVERIVIEREVDKRPGAGIYCLEITKDGVKSNKHKTFKPDRMRDCRVLGKVETVLFLARSARLTFG